MGHSLRRGQRAARVSAGLLMTAGGLLSATWAFAVWFWTGYEGGKAAVPGWTVPVFCLSLVVALVGVWQVGRGVRG